MAGKNSESFFIRKMKHSGPGEVQYHLVDLPMNELVGESIELRFTGQKQCIGCGREIKKTFQQGYCYPCFQALARCDVCMLKPELCHHAKGTCREPDWAEQNCFRDHVVYLANVTGLKVGITRGFEKFHRWGDQGAFDAIELAIVPDRLTAGLMEVALKEQISDRSNWRNLIKGTGTEIDLCAERDRICQEVVPEEFQQYLVNTEKYETPHQYSYPVQAYPEKALTINADKTPEVSGILNGIRGQYLFIGDRALNVRKYGGYEVEVNF